MALIRKHIILAALAAIVLSGCICDGENECSASICLDFDYTHNMYEEDRFGKEVNCILMLIYNEDGSYKESRHFYREELADGSRYKLVTDPGKYRIVIWGNYKDEFYDFDPGTHIDDMKFRVVSDNDNHIPTACSSLFYGYTEAEVSQNNTPGHGFRGKDNRR